MRRLALSVLSLVLVLTAVAAPAAADQRWSWPLGRTSVATRFDAPDTPYAAGHRGVDLPGAVGDVVRAVAPGRVVFAGRVGGIPVVSVSHGAERSTYQPVRAAVRTGDAVDTGQPLGRLVSSPSHCATPCLHLGRRRGDVYLDPAERLAAASRVRLVPPDGPPPVPAAPTGHLRAPVAGPVTSAFGQRVHPVTGVRKLHDGLDLGAPCGTPVHAAADGVVASRSLEPGYGNIVTLQHGGDVQTRYAHLSAFSAPVGRRVRTGDVIGLVGRTGLATGCHVHLMLVEHGHPVDPAPSL